MTTGIRASARFPARRQRSERGDVIMPHVITEESLRVLGNAREVRELFQDGPRKPAGT